MHTSAKFQLLQEAPKRHFIIVGIQLFNRTFNPFQAIFSKMGFNNNPCNSQCTTRSSNYPYLHIISNWVRGKLPPGTEFEWINWNFMPYITHSHYNELIWFHFTGMITWILTMDTDQIINRSIQIMETILP